MRKKGERENEVAVIHLGEKERDLLLMLYDMLFADIDFIGTYVYPDLTLSSVHRRVRGMEDFGYIKSFTTPRVEGDSMHNIKVVTLDRLGVEEVEALTGESHWDTRWTKRTPSFIHHLLQMAKMRAAFQKQEMPDFQLHTWVSERGSYYQYGQRKEDVIVPDGTAIFRRVMNDKAGDFAYFMEMERSRQRAVVSQNKLRRYNDYLGRDAVSKHPIFYQKPVVSRVCFISATEKEKLRLMEHTKDIDTSHIQAVLYTTYEEVISNPYGEIWVFKNADQTKYTMWKIKPN
ncbi:hypothetical protein BK138_34450 [Paenibacillus rhizosphaerae]|uniref:Uncharacterized protein n=1 Tax=Paenibacillus rhizosphaerae TaxID=297318 RepID=A0A1R1DYR9_9BACL|nr:replication-relaxation family protein [Paenibacillus rhizosphaerae]OMF44744.1 hypothetical protein BK138_34450 [Paenibacillus rhizosphaerae]